MKEEHVQINRREAVLIVRFENAAGRAQAKTGKSPARAKSKR